MRCTPRHDPESKTWFCPRCGHREPIEFTRDCHRITILPETTCPYGPIVERLTPEGLAGLERCRRAGCGMIHEYNGQLVCVGRGKSCEWLDLWAAWLNSGRQCPLWDNGTNNAKAPIDSAAGVSPASSAGDGLAEQKPPVFQAQTKRAKKQLRPDL